MNYIITIRYFNPVLKIGLQDVKNAWYLADKTPVQLTTIIYQGALYFRFPGSGRRISYKQLKKGLIKKQIELLLPLELLPFWKLSKYKIKKAGWLDNPLLWVFLTPTWENFILIAFVVDHNWHHKVRFNICNIFNEIAEAWIFLTETCPGYFSFDLQINLSLIRSWLHQNLLLPLYVLR